jgi:hypothetical protein
MIPGKASTREGIYVVDISRLLAQVRYFDMEQHRLPR